jgi:putative membrane protein
MKTFISGLIVGVANIVPGLSGGTILTISGLFDEVITALRNPFKNLRLLVPLASGVLIGLIGFSFVIRLLLQTAYIPTIFLFMGIVIGGALLFYQKELPDQKDFNTPIVLLGLALVLSLDFIPTSNTYSLILFLLSGFVAGATMILPGLSGALIFMILGQYETALALIIELTTFNLEAFGLLFLLLLSGVAGIFVMAFLLRTFIAKNRKILINVILGLILGSIYQMTPTPPLDLWWFSAILTLPAGMWLGTLFYKTKGA